MIHQKYLRIDFVHSETSQDTKSEQKNQSESKRKDYYVISNNS